KVREQGDELIMQTLHVESLPGDLREIHAFTLSHKSPAHVLMLLALAAELVFIGYALVVCARTPLKRRKWAWMLLCLVGAGGLGFDWTSGAFALKLFSVQLLFGISFTRGGPYAPWLLTVSLPIGAIMFLANRKLLLAAQARQPEPAPPVQ